MPKPRSDALSVIIPAAGSGQRMKQYGARSILNLKGRTLIDRQVEAIRLIYPRSEIVLVGGFEADRVLNQLPVGVRMVENENYEGTGVARSIGIALQAITNKNILIILGDLVFGPEVISGLYTKHSSVLSYSVGDVAIAHDGDAVTHLSFARTLKDRWGQIAFFGAEESALLRMVTAEKRNRKLTGMEVINKVIDAGGEVSIARKENIQIREIDKSSDIANALEIIK